MKDKNPLLTETGRGFSVLYRGRYLYSTTDPEGSAELKAKKTFLQGETLYLLPSPLLFYGTGDIVSRIPEGSHLICFELSAALLTLTMEHIPDFIDKSSLVTVIDNTSPLSVIEKVEQLGIWRFRRVRLLNLTGGYSLHASGYRTLMDNLNTAIEGYWKNRMTLIHMAPLWIKNIFLNLSRLYLSDSKVSVSSHPVLSTPVLVAGAGESLEDSINFIRTNRGKFKLMAVDTAVSVLVENDITPDFIVAVDAQIYNLFDFMKVKNSRVPLFFDLTGYPGIPPVLKGTIYPFISDFADTRLLNRLGEFKLLPESIPPLGSVGLSAVYLALKITDSYVFYTGLDFSYKIGKSHARGAPSIIGELMNNSRFKPAGQLEIYYQRPLITQKDKRGKPVITDLVLSSYAELMRNKFKESNRLFDIGSAGLHGGGKIADRENPFPSISKRNKPDLAENNRNINKTKENFIGFCKNEIDLLNKIYDQSYSVLSGGTENTQTLLQLLAEADYLYLHFPDKSPLPQTNEGFLKRILVTCGYYISFIEKISSRF